MAAGRVDLTCARRLVHGPRTCRQGATTTSAPASFGDDFGRVLDRHVQDAFIGSAWSGLGRAFSDTGHEPGQSIWQPRFEDGIEVQLASTENLNLPTLNDVDVGGCTLGVTTAEQNQLFGNRNNAGANDVVVYFVRSTVPPFNGCAAVPAGSPGAVVAQGATQWTLGH